MQTISAADVKARLDAGEALNLVDVREPFENADFNIGGVLVPLGKIQTMQTDDIDELKDQEVIVYCRSGNRSGQACLILETMGFSNVKNLVGGMMGWEATYGR
ncbi:MAG: rhodanese-like domain-containing protein [Chitinophagaceae bacterium]|uniref:rhodanese-like domain-containing protein n=1 Tax=unclassified Paraflavitalea TaxID=2798305 RepID=UPI003D34FBD3|nr:rhodanese-like domain-containing protein [Chitinophagaceae bacterium]